MKSFHLLIDTREKTPLEFLDPHILSVAREGMKTGDYTTSDLKDILCIERKRGANELATNICEDRFWREMGRLKEFPHKHIVCEFDWDHVCYYPEFENMPPWKKNKIRIKPAFLISRLAKIVDMGIELHFCEDREKAAKKICDIIQGVYANL